MTPDAVRLAIGFALIPLLPGLYFFLLGTLAHFNSPLADKANYWICYLVCALVAASIWFLLWRRRVAWTVRSNTWTIALLVVLLVSTCSILLPEHRQTPTRTQTDRIYDSVRWYAPFFGAAVWFGGTALIWRRPYVDVPEEGPTDEQLLQVVRCGQCGYSLRGLREVRCPECGWTSTVDEAVRRGVREIMELKGAVT